MDFSGAPILLVPEPLAGQWGGMFEPAPPAGDADLALPDGRRFRLRGCDFDSPVTDYDRICRLGLGGGRGPIFTHPVDSGTALVIDGDGDGVVGWWADQRILVTVSRHLPDPKGLDGLAWRPVVRWRSPSRRLMLMNSTLHGAAPGESGEDHLVIELEPGEYSVSRAQPEDDTWYILTRFTPIG